MTADDDLGTHAAAQFVQPGVRCGRGESLEARGQWSLGEGNDTLPGMLRDRAPGDERLSRPDSDEA